jgi:hypothetical protein
VRAVPATSRGLVALHVVLIAAFGAAALLDPPTQGWAVLGCVVVYNVALPLTARRAGRTDVVALWTFLLPLSILQVLPDWVLADLIGTLRFPDTGGPRVDDVIPVAMAGMWVAPLLIVVVLAGDSAWRAAAIGFAVFTGAELAAPLLGTWEPTDAARQLVGVALYVPPAEAVLSAATLLAWRWSRERPRGDQLLAASAVVVLYLGALVLAHFLIDVAHYSISL